MRRRLGSLAILALLSAVWVLAQTPNPATNLRLIAGPAVVISSPTSAATYDAGTDATVDLGGSASSSQTVSACTWTNSLGGSGTATGTTSWTIADLALVVGDNVITVTCTAAGRNGTDVLTVTRSSGSATNPIAAARLPAGNADVPNSVWAMAGVEGGIPARTTRCGAVIAAYTGSATTINNAIAACGSDQYVELGAGTFTLSSGIVFAKSNVTLRGQGTSTTRLLINGLTSACHLFYASAFRMCIANSNIGVDTPDQTATWSAGYAQGTTDITLSSTTGLVVGSTIWLDQLNDSSDGFPATGDIYVCDHGGTSPSPCSWQGGGSFYRSGRAQVEGHKVTAINGSTVTISPGVMAPNFRSARTPGAWWGNDGNIQKMSGVENLTIDWTGATDGVGLEMVNCTNCWAKNVRLIKNDTAGSFVMHFLCVNCFHVTFYGNYLYGPHEPPDITNYQITPMVSGLMLIENNILDEGISPVAPDDPESGNVYGYNFVVNSAGFGAPGFQPHASGDFYNLWEGNDVGTIFYDDIHGSHHFSTVFRNYINRFENQPGSPCAESCSGIVFGARSRFMNAVGNVIAHTGYTTYETNVADSDTSIFHLGYQGNSSPSNPGTDSNVKRTLFRWGNYNSVNDATRWCGNASNTGWTTTCASTTEVPFTITNYPNAIPSAETLPPSLYLSVKPAWMGSLAWPLIGPDVTGGIGGQTAGHAYKNPARQCYEAATTDPNYAASSPPIKLEVGSACPTP